MKKAILAVSILCLLSTISCASTKVKRVDADTVTDLSGYWNDTDVRIVCEDLISKCLSSGWYSSFKEDNNRKPVVIVGRIRNNSDEHIDTSIVAKKIEVALINSGKISAVASSTERSQVREERDDQQINSSMETAKNIGNETGADFMLQGDVRTIIDSNGKKSTRTYYINVELIHIETNEKVWVDENSEIKKQIKKSSLRG